MSSDILDRASRALREETRSNDTAARFTRARVMASLHRSERKRRSRLALLVPIAAVLVGSSAWAASNGRVSFAGFARATGLVEPAPSAPPQAVKSSLARKRFENGVSASRPPAHAPSPREPVAVVNAPPSPAPPVAPASRAPKPEAADAELDLYRVAHRAHFSGANATAALGAWDEYLRRAPRGRFALEASYNRAICLVRLGRTAEARRALEGFAQGRYGEYRRESARALLEAL